MEIDAADVTEIIFGDKNIPLAVHRDGSYLGYLISSGVEPFAVTGVHVSGDAINKNVKYAGGIYVKHLATFVRCASTKCHPWLICD